MRSINPNIIVLACLLSSLCVSGQEHLRSLGGSSTLMEAWKSGKAHASTQKTLSVTAQFLPFSDDFSYAGPYPDPNRWVNSTSVFVNRTKATIPITVGVATFDGMKANGYPYNPAATTGSYNSDTLTSIPLRLDSLNGVDILPTDSVTLRFYYQARGIWEKPDAGDDLILEFYEVNQNHWKQVWSASGGVAPANNDFKRVMLAITDTAYLKNGFQFRFRNYSSCSGDVDHWHLDAIYMDKKLNPAKDTIVGEMSFSFELPSLLKNYSQMPFEQYAGASDMITAFDLKQNLRNNFNTAANIITGYNISDNNGTSVANWTSSSGNFWPYKDSGYYYTASFLNPSLNGYAYNGGAPFADSTSYLVKFYDSWPSDPNRVNDTIYYRQKFNNYYAYDDGTAETGYGVGQNGVTGGFAVGAFTAVRYQLNVADSLRAIDIYFDPTSGVSSLENDQIRLYVWDDNSGLPGTILHIDSVGYPYPVFSQNGFDIFQRYQLSKAVGFNASATFYIGVMQQLGLPLYIGYDLNTDHRSQVLYRTPNYSTNPGWNTSAFQGSLMMRPVFGDPSRAIGVQDHNIATRTELYPNPADNVVRILSAGEIKSVAVCDITGKTLIEQTGNEINTSTLPSGMYFVKVSASNGCTVHKLLIAR